MCVSLAELFNSFMEEVVQKNANIHIDFVGFNYNLGTKRYEIKEYDYPISCLKSTPHTKNSIIEYLERKKMNRFLWVARDSSSKKTLRYYVCLKNRNNENITDLLNQLSDEYSCIRENVEEINIMNKMKICDNDCYQYSSLYLLGFKNSAVLGDNSVGIEWITRKCPDPDDIGFEHSFDDVYFEEFLDETQIEYFQKIKNKLKGLIGPDLHYWVFSIDFAEKKKKYKIYLKGSSFNTLLAGSDILKKLFSKTDKKTIQEIDDFIYSHNELLFYGIALCIDTEDNWSINLYFKPV